MRAPTFVILIGCFASLALADDFKTINGKEYKSAKVSRVEPDGIVLITKSGISKVYFAELPKEVQERFHYDVTEGDAYTRKQNEALEQLRKQQEALQQEKLGRMRWISGRIISKSNNALLIECSGEGLNRSDAATGRIVLRDHANFAVFAEGDRVAVFGVEISATQWGGHDPYLHAYRVPR
jgi:hypothetical protein